jgi:hypothetical protein
MPAAGITHDIVLEDYDARHRRGFMYARGRRGRRPFDTREAQPIAPRQLTMGELTQSEDPPTIALNWFQDSWIKGIGGKNFRVAEDRGKLATSKKIETYPYGTLRPAREMTSTTLDATPGADSTFYVPSGFAVAPRDTSSGLTGGFEETELWAFIGGFTYSGGDDNWVRGTRPQNSINYRNGTNYDKWVVAPGWWDGTDMDDIAMPYIYKEPTVAAWVASTKVEGRFKHFAVSKNNAGNDVLWGGNNVTDTGKTVSGAHNNSTTTITANADISGDVSANDIIVCGVGADAEQEAMLVTAVSSAAMTVIRAYGDGAVIYEGGEKIHVLYPHGIRSSSDPTNSGSWSSLTTIGQKESPIVGLAVEEDTDTLLIAKTDGLWQQYYEALEDGGRLFVRNLTIDFRGSGHPGNFRGIHIWNKMAYLPMGRGGLLEYNVQSGQARDISFTLTADEFTDLHGVVLAMASSPSALYVALKDASDEVIHILAGHMVNVDGQTDLRWDMIGEVGAGATITDAQTTLWYDSSRNDHSRLWIGFTESGVSVTPKFIPVGIAGEDKSDGYTNDTDCEAVFTTYDGNLPRVPKHFSEMEVESKNLGVGGRQWAFDYRLDNDPTWVSWDTVSVSPFQTVAFPPGTSGNLLEIRARPAMTSVGTTPPEIVSIRVKSQLHPDPTKIFPVEVYLADNQIILNGTEGGRVRGDLNQLETWNGGAADLTLATPDKTSRQVIFLPGSMQQRESYKEHGRHAEYHVSFLLAEV